MFVKHSTVLLVQGQAHTYQQISYFPNLDSISNMKLFLKCIQRLMHQPHAVEVSEHLLCGGAIGNDKDELHATSALPNA